MLKHTLVVLPLILSLTISSMAQTPAPLLDKDAARIRYKVEDLGVGHRITVKLKNGDDYHGAVSKIDQTSFEVAEVDLGQAVKFSYAEVKSVRGDYGSKNIFGQRVNPKHARIVVFGVLGGLLAITLLAIPRT